MTIFDGNRLMPQPQSCRSCRLSAATPPKWGRNDWLRCDAPIPEMPASMDVYRSSVRPDDGQTCPTWALRTTNKEQNHD